MHPDTAPAGKEPSQLGGGDPPAPMPRARSKAPADSRAPTDSRAPDSRAPDSRAPDSRAPDSQADGVAARADAQQPAPARIDGHPPVAVPAQVDGHSPRGDHPPLRGTAPGSPLTADGTPTIATVDMSPLNRWMRAVLPWTRSAATEPSLDTLIRIHRQAHPRADAALLRRTYTIAEGLHHGQLRHSGEAYITHPIAVAQILAELGMDTTTLAAALLHDTVEDTSYTIEQLREEFGEAVTHLVDGVTKLDRVYFGEVAEAETLRKMIVAAGRDVRVMIIKLADRLHNMRTLRYKSRTSQLRTAEATRDVLVPLADRLGINVLKRQLEDLVLYTVDPDMYLEIDRYVQDQTDQPYLESVMDRVRLELRRSRVQAIVTPRPRHYASIQQEMVATATPEPFTAPRLAVIVNGQQTDCYAALGAIHGLWQPVPGRFKDFIASPKFNLYQSLHTTVIGPENQPIEVLIRTEAMHRTAEYGIVVRFQEPGSSTDAEQREELDWLHRLLAWQSEAVSTADFLESLRCDLSEGQILVFTTDGGRALLPADATPVDLAYTLDTQLGDRLIGAYVNGRLVPLSSRLEDGDVVEIITANDKEDFPGPSPEWLGFVKSPHAHLQISQWFARQGDDQQGGRAPLVRKLDAGRSAIGRALRRYERGLADDAPLIAVARGLGYPDMDALLVAVSDQRLSADDVVSQLIARVDHA